MNDLTMWGMIYAGLCSFEMHPGNKTIRDGHMWENRGEHLANIADQLFIQYKKREALWPGSHQ